MVVIGDRKDIAENVRIKESDPLIPLISLIKSAIDGDPVSAAGALLGLKGLKDPQKLIGALSSATSKAITAEKLAEELKRIKDSKTRRSDEPKECR